MDSFMQSLPKLPDSAEMRTWDKAAIDFGIPEEMLMEAAGRAVYEVAREKFGKFQRVCLFMGGGNNGGDAACAARHVYDSGALAALYCLKPLETMRGAAAWHCGLATKDGVEFNQLDLAGKLAPSDFLASFLDAYGAPPDLIIDGLLGTGFTRQLRPKLLSLIEMINALCGAINCPILAIDVPSGLNADNGKPSPQAIHATVTVTLAAAKSGLLQPSALPYTGELICRPIGIPVALTDSCSARYRLLNGECLSWRPTQISNSYKNEYGHVVIFGGANGYAGAAHIAAAAALRTGAGLVTACAPADSLAQIKADWPEIMIAPAAEGAEWPSQLTSTTLALIRAAQALVIGPGLGRGADAAAFLKALLALTYRPPAVIDADALILMAQAPDRLMPGDVITPHPGEAGALLGCTASAVQKDRPGALDKLCALGNAAVVLKGAATLLGQGDGQRLLCPYDIPGLAIGGAGDALSGCIGALLASRQFSGLATLSKAGLGVLMHAITGLELARQYPDRGFLASQLADALAHAREFACDQAKPLAGILPWPQ